MLQGHKPSSARVRHRLQRGGDAQVGARADSAHRVRRIRLRDSHRRRRVDGSHVGRRTRYREAHPEIRVTVLRNEFNQGYGGNQKVGYAFAIREGFDFVAMVHGDGQYAPEELPSLVAPLRDGEADAVFGSRMMTRFGALRGGMPLYKFVGNKILTSVQNLLLGTTFSEFHSGYRVYSVAALNKVAFQLNSNVFHFDTEIIIQLLNARQRIVERSIPTYYGDDQPRERDPHAKGRGVTTLQNVAHRAGLLYQRRFEPVSERGNTYYDVKLGYASSHQFALDAVSPGARVIDIGAGPGGMARELLKKGCRVAVVDQFAPAGTTPSGVRVFQQDLDRELTFEIGEYQYLLLLDVIEHLKDPELFLDRLRTQFDYTTKTLVLSTPNIAFVVQRVMLLLGQFNYGKVGILDRTHTRLFTFRSLRHLLDDSGFRIKELRGVPAPFPKVLGDGILGRAAVAINQLLIRISKSLFSYQIFVVAETTPHVDFILKDSKARSQRTTSAIVPMAGSAER